MLDPVAEIDISCLLPGILMGDQRLFHGPVSYRMQRSIQISQVTAQEERIQFLLGIVQGSVPGMVLIIAEQGCISRGKGAVQKQVADPG